MYSIQLYTLACNAGKRLTHLILAGLFMDNIILDDNTVNDALIVAAGDGDLKAIHECLSEGADIDYLADDDDTALISAIRCYQIESIKTLLSLGADPDNRGSDDWPPVENALYDVWLNDWSGGKPEDRERSLTIAGLLASHGADLSCSQEIENYRLYYDDLMAMQEAGKLKSISRKTVDCESSPGL